MRHPILKFLFAGFALVIAVLFQTADGAEVMSDTLSLTLNGADSIFQSENLQLLANHMNVDIASAQIIAARLWDNPVFNYDMNIWNPVSRKPFDITHGGQVYMQIEQLFKTGGKRHRLVQYNKANRQSVEYAYYDLLRNLKFEMHSDFYQLNALLKTKQAYQVEIDKVKTLEQALSEQYDKSNIALKDLVRIQSTLFQLQADYNDVQSQASDLESELRQLLQIPPQKFITPSTDSTFKKDFSAINLDTLYSVAITNRADLKASETLITAAEWNLKYQRSMIAPDLTVGLEYDKESNYTPNYYGLFLSIPLPILNQNKGGIKEAKASLQQQQYVMQDSKQKAVNEVNSAYQKLLQAATLDIDTQKKKNESFDKLIQNILSLYVRKEISLKDLSDFMDLYKAQTKSYNDYVAKFQTARDELNYAVGTVLLK